MAKFNSGYLRTVDVQKTFFETTVTISKTKGTTKEYPGYLPGEGLVRTENVPVVNQGGDTGNTGTTGTSGTSGDKGTSGDNGTSGNSGDKGTSGGDKGTTVPGSGDSGTKGTTGVGGDQSKLLGGQK